MRSVDAGWAARDDCEKMTTSAKASGPEARRIRNVFNVCLKRYFTGKRDEKRKVVRLSSAGAIALAGVVMFALLTSNLGSLAAESESYPSGRDLAQKYCTACHVFPEQTLLDKATWKNAALPLMRTRLGIDQFDAVNPQQKIALNEWDSICKYYLDAAPEKAIPQPPREKIQMGLKQFEVVNPGYRPGKRYVTMLSIDEASHQIYVGNADTKTLDTLDADGHLLASLPVESPPVALIKGSSGWICTLIGRVPPHDQKLGKVILLEKSGAQFTQKATLLSDLARPSDCVPMDVNGDGREDLIVSAFGNILGSFSWYENLGGGRYAERVLLDRPGALRCELRDFDGDGRKDLAVLMAQGREGFNVLFNEGGGRFSALEAIQQPPTWGYAGFQLADFDGDGHIDLVTANGDNGEYPSCLKGYHGVRVYLNRGQAGFKESFFYPINGAFCVGVRDFDHDGDLDIACAAYFPDYAGSPEESFVFLENLGGLRFRPYSFPEAPMGRWLVMATGDIDGDGFADIVLGAANRTPYGVPKELNARWEREGPSILILKNRGPRK